MRVPVVWLHEYSAPPITTAELAERLALTGTEVERVERHGVAELENFVVGRVLEASQHPDADRLRVCLVDIGTGEPSQIVCGAPNVGAGQTVAVARPGAVMPDGTKLRKAKLRGQESNGMILAEDELAIGTDHNGILVLEDDGLRPGSPLEDVFALATDVLVLEITPNRPDCLGLYGVAREVHAATGAPLSPPPWASDPGEPGEVSGVRIKVEDPDLCPRFTARVFEEVTIAPSPPWLKARLMSAGQRPISNVVDITNYVMLLTGQPLHAFDLDRIAGAQLTVRRARPGERVETLDGQTRTLDGHMLLIEDAEGPTSIAGVMGGARSEVQLGTTRVLMEAANWNGANVHRTSLTLGLRSEASGRFEKGLAPEQAMDAQAVAARLMIELCGARLLPGTIDIGGPGPAPATIRLRERRIAELLGATVSRQRAREILTSLEFGVADAPDGLDVTVPAFRRNDVTREADLIEEVARIDGVDKLPATLPATRRAAAAALRSGGGQTAAALTPRQRLRRRAADILAGQGVHEIVGWSFVSPSLHERLRLGDRPGIELANPMSAEQSQLRTTLLGSLLDVAQRNLARDALGVRLFEAGAVYLPRAENELPDEPYRIGAVLIGPVGPASWRHPDPPRADVFAAKGVLGAALDALRVPWSVTADPWPFLHPARSATIRIDGTDAGWLGELHPSVAAAWDITDAVAAFEVDLDLASDHAGGIQHFEDFTSFPEIREDLAVIVDDTVTAAQVLEVARRAGAPLVRDARVFDVYRDPDRIGAGKVSLAIRLTYRTADRTLTDREVAERRAQIAAALERELGGQIRGA